MRRLADRLSSAIIDRIFRGLPPRTHAVRVQRDLRVPMDDGVVLLADLWLPIGPDPRAPTVVVRSPYGRRGVMGLLNARVLSARGFPVLISSCRGTFGSGGVFTPQIHERDDGAATLRWVRRQPWFTGRLAMTGASYLGYAQWAAAGPLSRREPQTAPDALCLHVTMADFGAVTYENGAFTLRTALGWTRMMARQERRGAAVLARLPSRRLRRAMDHLPLKDTDTLAIGTSNRWYQDWLAHDDLSDPYWTQQSHTASVDAVTAPVLMIAGWYDIFLPWQLDNYATLVSAGNQPSLIIGPWGHTSPELHTVAAAETITFLRHRFLGGVPAGSNAVRVYVTGADEWREYDRWPPAGAQARDWMLHAGAVLATEPAADGAPDRYVYDPRHPTPAIGGPSLAAGSEPVDNAAHERRSDVLTYTTRVLAAPLEVLGTPRATIQLRSDRECTDLFVRLCDVHPDGRSMNVSDGMRRLGGPGTGDAGPAGAPGDDDGVRQVALELWPTAHRFRAGHRIRVQISSGAHPRYARNPGGGEPTGDATRLVVAHQEIVHDRLRPSVLTLPVCQG